MLYIARPGIVYITKPGIRLLRTNENVWIEYEGKVDTFTQVETIVLLLSDGTNTLEEVAQKIATLYDENYETVFKDVLNFYETRHRYFIKVHKKLNKPLQFVRDPNEFKFLPQKRKVKQFYGLWDIGIVLSEKCPMRCKYCYAFDGKHDVGLEFVEFNLVKKFILESAELGANKLTIGGGDPLRYIHLLELINLALQNGFKKIDISTKPTKVYDLKYFDNLFKVGLRELQFSIDAITPEVLNELVGHPKYYDYLIPSLFNAIHAGLDIVVKTVLIKDNIGEIAPLINFLYDFGIRKINISTASPIGMATFNMLPSLEEEKEIEKELNNFKQSHPDVQINYSQNIFNYNNVEIVRCSAFKTSCFLFPDGSIEGCDFVGAYRKKFHLSLGNLKEKSLKEIWFDSEKSYLYRSVPNDSPCTACALKDACLGGCKAFSIRMFNDVYRSFNYCEPVLNEITTER